MEIKKFKIRGKSLDKYFTSKDWWYADVFTVGTILSGLWALCEIDINHHANLSSLVTAIGIAILLVLIRLIFFTYEVKKAHNELKRIVINKTVKASDFFFDIKEVKRQLPISELVKKRPKKLLYSGGHLNEIILNEDIQSYLRENDVEFKCIFPNPNNEDIIRIFTEYITLNETQEGYINKIRSSVQILDELMRNCKATIDYRFFDKMSPPFGLQIIEMNDNDGIIYADQYDIQVNKKERLQYRTDRSDIIMYQYNIDQFNKFWNILSIDKIEIQKAQKTPIKKSRNRKK